MPVRVGDLEVGTVAALILDRLEETALGFELRARSGRRYFLPLPLAVVRPGHVSLASPLHLVDDIAHYRARGRTLLWDEAAGAVLDPVSGRLESPPAAPTTPVGGPPPSPRGA
jgi:hypothetical protein